MTHDRSIMIKTSSFLRGWMAAKTQKSGSTTILYMHLLSVQLHVLNSTIAQIKIPFLNEFGLCQ